MVGVRTSPPADAVNQRAAHTLWVEGKDEDSGFDVAVLNELLGDTGITIKGLGPSSNIRSVAEALHRDHPDYYFLVDRDHFDDQIVEGTWKNFPDENVSNLLIWRRRSLESYFIASEFIRHSSVLKRGADVDKLLVSKAAERVFMDVANLTIIEIREGVKETWGRLFTDPTECRSAEQALDNLKGKRFWSSKTKSVNKSLSAGSIEAVFRKLLDLFLDGRESPEPGVGRWLELMAPKPLFRELVNRCCDVKDESGNRITGRDAEIYVARDLVKRADHAWPSDFSDLKRMVRDRLNRR